MKHQKLVVLLLAIAFSVNVFAQKTNQYKADFRKPVKFKGMKLVWNDEFNTDGKPDPSNWIYENGFVRNQELQWYQPNNANCIDGLLVIEGRGENIGNTNFVAGSNNWKRGREYAEYTSACIETRGLKQWKFGRFEIRARIDTACGSWPAIWTLGVSGDWPGGGEIDIMEFYRREGVPIILANFAWGTEKQGTAKWDDLKKPLSDFTVSDPDWTKKFHIWRMDWDKDSIKLYLDNLLLNDMAVGECVNPNGFNPFLQPHYLLLNLALGANGGDPSKSKFPIKYEIDWIRVYQRNAF
jgi:beta-glucanase (GH16 family)